MRVLQINSVCGIGSTGRIVTDLHALLLAEGHQSHVAYGRGEGRHCEQPLRIGTRLDTYRHVGLTRLFDAHGFGSATATKALISHTKKLDPDVIHLHNLHGYYLHIGELFQYLKHARIPVVWTLHDCWALTGHCPYFDLIGCIRWQKECHHCPQKRRYPRSLGFDRSRWNHQQKKLCFTGVERLTLVTPSNWLAGLVKQSFLRDYPLQVIHNGIDVDMFEPGPSSFRMKNALDGRFVILGVASTWEERKGYDYFLELAEQLKPDEILVLVGVTAKQLNRLPKSVIGISRTNSTRELSEIYGAADLFVNPTLEDNFPTTNLEALACGTPVLTFDSGGSPETVDEGCGLVVPRGNLKALVAGIATVKARGKKAYTAHCLQRAKKSFNKNSQFAQYIDLYSRVLDATAIRRG